MIKYAVGCSEPEAGETSQNGEAQTASPLLQPVALGGVLILILNDHVLKAANPGWMTGKLSDVAGLAFFPFFLIAVYELCCAVGRRSPAPRAMSLAAASVITGLAFALVEVTSWGESMYRDGLGLLQWIPTGLGAVAVGQPPPAPQPVLATSDPLDLVALAVLPLLNIGAARRSLLRPRLRLSRHPRFERMAGVVVLAVASTAVVATSPPPEPESFVNDEYVEEIELTADQPVAIRELAVRLNREAMTFDTRPAATARLKLVPVGGNPVGSQGLKEADSLGDAVMIQVVPNTAGDPPMVSAVMSADGLRFFEYAPAWGVDTCVEGESCERTYEILLELRDASAAPVTFNLVAEGEIRYSQDAAPAGAAVAIEPRGELQARGPLPVVDAQVEGVVDPTLFEQAEVHVRITRSGAAGAAEPEAEAVLTIQSLDARPEQASPRVNVSFGLENRVGLHQGPHERYQLGAQDLPQSVIVGPFRSCPAEGACTVEYSIGFSLCCSAGEDLAASIAWSFGVTLRYPDATDLAPGTTLEIGLVPDARFQEELVQRCIGVGREIIAAAQRSWSLPLIEAETQRAKLDRGEWLPEMVSADWRAICDQVLAGRLDPSEPIPSIPP